MVVSERGRCVLHIVPHTPHVRQACTGRREGGLLSHTIVEIRPMK